MGESDGDITKHLPRNEPVLTDARMKKRDVGIEPGDRGGVQYRSYQDPLAFYYRRGHINLHQMRAGEKLYGLWYYGSPMSGYRMMSYDDMRKEASDAHASALLSTEFRNAIDAIRGLEPKKTGFDVCCVGELAGRERMHHLREALDDLVEHFKKLRSDSW